MKSFKTCFLLLFIGTQFCRAEDTILVVKPAMFDKYLQEIYIASLDGWYFKEGNDTAWAKKDIDIAGWKKMKPTELSKKMADKNGRVEGWFRLKIKLDDSLKHVPLGIKTETWAASDVYLDGQWLGSIGNTGIDGNPFKENRYLSGFTSQLNLVPGKEYTLALHVVDYLSPFPPARLKSEDYGPGLTLILRLSGPKYNSQFLNHILKWNIFPTIWFTVCAVLSLLFWLLFAQNHKEKNLKPIALCTTFLSLWIFCINASQNIPGLSYISQQLISYLALLLGTLYFIMIPIILANVFKGNVSLYLRLYLIGYFIGSFIIQNLVPEFKIGRISSFTLFAVCLYYVISSWKNLKGAQWSIVASILSTLFWLFMFIIKNNGTFQFPYVLLYTTGICLSIPIGLLVYVSFRFKEINREVRENALKVVQMSEEKKEQALNQQKRLQEEVTRQTAEIRTTLDNLKSTQAQLIQAEKMASLGELTAGIAHEIQNPLNFVNNFSELSVDLAKELKEEIDKVDIPEKDKEYIGDILSDLSQNQEKINHHGKRASSIVKGMLEHSRKSSGTKELTDINALADEYLKLVYQSLRAKDKDFNAELITDFDPNLPKVEVVSQDIGRVLLNLITNAFYAVNERSKKGEEGYKPTVSISTRLIANSPTSQHANTLVIAVKDNGSGIPDAIKDKIFQPFFTTKPTGQGTGLGLSLSYDIVRAHGGELKVETNEREGSEFIIQLPI